MPISSLSRLTYMITTLDAWHVNIRWLRGNRYILAIGLITHG